MKMILEVKLFFLAEGENLDARSLKMKLTQMMNERCKAPGIFGIAEESEFVSFKNLEGTGLKAKVTLLSEEKAYDKLK
jgi:hypothetical protein